MSSETHPILPSHNRRRTSEDLTKESAEYFSEDSAEAPAGGPIPLTLRHTGSVGVPPASVPDCGQDARAPFSVQSEQYSAGGPSVRVSATTLTRASQCLLRGLLAARGEKGVGPSPFSRATMEDGNEFEAALFEESNRPLWIRGINKALGTEIGHGAPFKEAPELDFQRVKLPEDLAKRAQTEFDKLIKGRSAPFILWEPRLAIVEDGCLISGKPDLLIYTGTEWIIGDIKCSEEGRRTHGIQIAAYDRMLKVMSKTPRSARGVVVHCATGFRFTATSSDDQKAECLAHTQATAFLIETLVPSMEALLKELKNPGDEAIKKAADAAVFGPVCNECEYRVRCYPRFVETRHLSLLPLGKAQVKVLLAAKLRSLDDVLAAIKDDNHSAHSTLCELLEGSPLQLDYLRQKAESVIGKCFYSAWRAPEATTAKPLLFASTGDQGVFDPPLEHAGDCTCLVVYTEPERRKAWARMYAHRGDWNSIKRVHVLSEEIQQTIHGLVPSLTLTPLAEFVKWSDQGGKLDGFTDWFAQSYGGDNLGDIKEPASSKERLAQLKTVWEWL